MLHIDFANCLEDRVAEHGLEEGFFDGNSPASAAATVATRKLAQTRGTGWERWRELTNDPMRGEHVRGVKAAVSACKQRNFENMVVLGIGGSALGNIAVQSALSSPTWNMMGSTSAGGKRNGPRLFVIDNVDPAYFGSIMDLCEANGGVEKTLFNVISKSGETAETAAQFMIIREMLKKRL
jgi:glucose-6-phosphate isomerase